MKLATFNLYQLSPTVTTGTGAMSTTPIPPPSGNKTTLDSPSARMDADMVGFRKCSVCQHCASCVCKPDTHIL